MTYLQCPNPRCNSFEVKSSKGFLMLDTREPFYFLTKHRKIISYVSTFALTLFFLNVYGENNLLWGFVFTFLTTMAISTVAILLFYYGRGDRYKIKSMRYECKKCKYKWQAVESFGGRRAIYRAFCNKILQDGRKAGRKQDIAIALLDLGSFAGDYDNDWPRAVTMCEEALALSQFIPDRNINGYCCRNLGEAFIMLGQYDRGLPLLEQSVNIFYQTSYWEGYGHSLELLGKGWLFLRQYDRAQQHFRMSLDFKRKMQKTNSDSSLGSIEGMAAIAAASNDMERALKLWGAAQVAREGYDAPLPQVIIPFYDYVVSAAYDRLGQSAATQALQTGRAMSVDEAIDYALA